MTADRSGRRLKLCFGLAEKADQADGRLEIGESTSESKVYTDSTYASGFLSLKMRLNCALLVRS